MDEPLNPYHVNLLCFCNGKPHGTYVCSIWSWLFTRPCQLALPVVQARLAARRGDQLRAAIHRTHQGSTKSFLSAISLDAERSTEATPSKEADARRRDKAQAEYVEDFHGAVVTFLAFHPRYADLADELARAVADHATPVGSGTVARTKRIPVEQCAEAAVIAWMRHRTTAYESMTIPRVKGKRREVRRMLAQRSKELLKRYRRGEPVGKECPLKKALN